MLHRRLELHLVVKLPRLYCFQRHARLVHKETHVLLSSGYGECTQMSTLNDGLRVCPFLSRDAASLCGTVVQMHIAQIVSYVVVAHTYV